MADPVSPEPASPRAVSSTRPRQVTVQYAAGVHGVSTTTIRRWIVEGRLKAYRSGPKLIRVDLDSVEALLVPIGKL